MIRKPERSHHGWLIEIATVKDDGLLQEALHDLKIRIAKLLPLRDDHQAVCSFQCPVGAITVRELLSVDFPNVVLGFRIVRSYLDVLLQEGINQH